jgi:hypothetical protein
LIENIGTNDESNGEMKKIFDALKKDPVSGIPTYKGFPIFSVTEQTNLIDNNDNSDKEKNRREFDKAGTGGKTYNSGGDRFNKTNIDNFRKAGGEFVDESKIALKDLRGFQPGDIGNDGKTYVRGNVDIKATTEFPEITFGGSKIKIKYSEATKRCFDILSAGQPNGTGGAKTGDNVTVDDVIKSIFQGSDFQESIKYTRKQTLDVYFELAKVNQRFAPKYSDATDPNDTKTKLDEVYREGSELIELIETD